jgi:replicative DNA helicase
MNTYEQLHIKPAILEVIKELSEINNAPQAYAGRFTSTSFAELDKRIIGLARGDLIVAASRPGVGKTTFAVNMAVNIAKKYKDKKVAIFSLEMSKEQLIKRILSSEASVTTERMKAGDIDKDGWKCIVDATDRISNLGIYIDDTTYITIGELKTKLKRMGSIDVVVIDYLQLLSYKGSLSKVSMKLKNMAEELGVTVILTTQLSRKLEKRQDKRPQLSDLRENGSIEQDADVVLMLYRECFYDLDVEFPNHCKCFIEKNRRGFTGAFDLDFEGEFYRFSSAEFIY